MNYFGPRACAKYVARRGEVNAWDNPDFAAALHLKRRHPSFDIRAPSVLTNMTVDGSNADARLPGRLRKEYGK